MMLLAAALAFAVSSVVVRVLLSSTLSGLAVDHPNERSLHATPVPRTGGLAILSGAALSVLLQPSREALLLWAIALGLAALSFIDDRRGLPVLVRLAGQFGAAALAALLHQQTYALLALLGLFFTVWMTNLYNFMDGADGLAGGMAVAGFSAYAVAGLTRADPAIAVLGVSLASASLGFLTLNLPPARIFMGDIGSTALGFLAASIGLYGHARGVWPLWFPVLVFLPFVVDASVTLARRALRRERVWEAHREHYYQRMIRSGWGHRRMAVVAYALMLGTGVSALLALRLHSPFGWIVLGSWLAVFAALMRAVDARWLRHLTGSSES